MMVYDTENYWGCELCPKELITLCKAISSLRRDLQLNSYELERQHSSSKEEKPRGSVHFPCVNGVSE
jgi:hypothetical protein